MNLKRATCLFLFLGCTLGLRALDLQYGTLFTVRGITLEKGRPVMPTTRGKYVNVRVLDKDTYQLLKRCTSPCKQQEAEGKIEIVHLRAAKSRPGMWISEVAVDKKWLLTFLIFKNENKFSFIAPDVLAVSDTNWLARVQTALQERLEQEK